MKILAHSKKRRRSIPTEIFPFFFQLLQIRLRFKHYHHYNSIKLVILFITTMNSNECFYHSSTNFIVLRATMEDFRFIFSSLHISDSCLMAVSFSSYLVLYLRILHHFHVNYDKLNCWIKDVHRDDRLEVDLQFSVELSFVRYFSYL